MTLKKTPLKSLVNTVTTYNGAWGRAPSARSMRALKTKPNKK